MSFRHKRYYSTKKSNVKHKIHNFDKKLFYDTDRDETCGSCIFRFTEKGRHLIMIISGPKGRVPGRSLLMQGCKGLIDPQNTRNEAFFAEKGRSFECFAPRECSARSGAVSRLIKEGPEYETA